MATTDVAVFVDFENIYISIRNKYGEQPNFDSIRDKCEEYGRVTIARAYADWYRYPRVTNALYANSIEPMYVPTYYYDREEGRIGRAIKNSVDIHMCIDCMKTLYTHPNIDTYVIITGDRDFIPLINAIRQQGKRAIVIGVADAASSHLAQSADEFIFYSNVVDKYDEEDDGDNGRRPGGKREKDPYSVLVQAVKLARQRGNLATLATLKLLMVELMGDFDETKLKDKKGRPFSKFRDFVREAEQRNLVQVFSSGSVTEVFLPGEDPLKLSQFAPESLEDEIEVIRPRQPEPEPTPAAESASKSRSRRSGRKGKPSQPAAPTDGVTVEPEIIADVAPAEEPEPHAEPEVIEPELEGADGLAEDIGEEEWQIFREMMQQFDQPVLFIEIFDSLRALRNKEVLDLSNKQMKEMIKESINRKLLVRSTRGNHAYYRLNPDFHPDGEADDEPEGESEIEPAE